MGFPSGAEILLHADVQLARSYAEPAAAAGAQRSGLFYLFQPQQAAKEAARFRFASAGSGDLHVIEVGDPHAYMPPGPCGAGGWCGSGGGISLVFHAHEASTAAPSLIASGRTLSKVSVWLWCASR